MLPRTLVTLGGSGQSNGTCSSVVLGVRNREQNALNSLLVGDSGAFAGERDLWLAQVIINDLDVLPTDLAPPSSSQRLQNGFLGRETTADMWNGIAEASHCSSLLLRQDAIQETLRVALQDSTHPIALDKVNAMGQDIHDDEATEPAPLRQASDGAGSVGRF